ncbi:MAG: ATP-binding protein, partial [Roseburia sp.]|nr:ATP-binding protein [Roseburia sp.]
LALSAVLTMTAVAAGWTVWVSALYYPAPLAASVLIFLLCSEGSAQDAVYGMGCAYAAQHMAFCVVTILWGEQHLYGAGPLLMLGSWLTQGLAVLACWFFFARRLPVGGAYDASWQKALLHTGVVVFMAMILNRMVREVSNRSDPTTYAICLVYDLFVCLFTLLFQLGQRRELRLQAAVEVERGLRIQAQEQYRSSRENIDIINRKCHDLKHQVSALRLIHSPEEREDSLREIERQVMIYDTAARTGNEVLDTVLTEKGLLCEQDGISWSCMADGTVLDFISPVDLYILLGNALDNAIESSRAIPSPERRVVRLSVRREHGAAFIQVENYYDHSLREDGGVLRTTKENSADHGFGLRSIRSVTEQYGGTLDVETEDGKFLLSILIPVPFRR